MCSVGLQAEPLLFEYSVLSVRDDADKTIDFRFQLRDQAGRSLEISDEIYHLLIDDYSHEQSLQYHWGRRNWRRSSRAWPGRSRAPSASISFSRATRTWRGRWRSWMR